MYDKADMHAQTIVKGQFDYDHRRWAEQYAVGDIQAREQVQGRKSFCVNDCLTRDR